MTAAVTRAEANLLTLARTAVGLVPAADVTRLLTPSVDAPKRLGPTAQRLLADTLSRGVVLTLARGGGWLSVDGGPLWQSMPPPPLEFTGNVVRLLQWLLKTPMGEADGPSLPHVGPLTLAESVVVTSLLFRLRGTASAATLARQQVVRTSPLVALAHAAALGRVDTLPAPDFDVAALAPFVVGLRTLLARSWAAAEQAKGDEFEPEQLSRIGLAQEKVLDAWLDAIDAAGQRPLAGFLVDAAVEWLRIPRGGEELVRSLSSDTSLRELSLARRRAGAFLRTLRRLRTWDREHREVRFIDDGYEVAQDLVSDWERLGNAGFDAAQAQVASLDALP